MIKILAMVASISAVSEFGHGGADTPLNRANVEVLAKLSGANFLPENIVVSDPPTTHDDSCSASDHIHEITWCRLLCANLIQSDKPGTDLRPTCPRRFENRMIFEKISYVPKFDLLPVGASEKHNLEFMSNTAGWGLSCVLVPKCSKGTPIFIQFGSNLNSVNGNISPNLCFADFAGYDNGIICGFYSPPRFSQRFFNPDYTHAAYQQHQAGSDHHPESPFRHILLSIKVLSGFCLILGGLGGFYHTLAQSGWLSVNASGQRALFSLLIMLAGAYLIASNLYTEGSPRCIDDSGDTENYEANKKCF